MSSEVAFTTTDESTSAALDPAVSRLLQAAGGPTGLSLLLLLGRNPMICDTASGFALRLRRPVAEVGAALLSLSNLGVLTTSRGPNNMSAASFWVTEDAATVAHLRSLAEAYWADPNQRRLLLRALRLSQAAA